VRPLVSFIIPVHDNEVALERCLSSIVSNTYPRELVEIIVVASDPTETSTRAARRHGAMVLQNPERSVSALRNKGARAALGAILAFVDAEDEIDPQWIETAVDVMSDPNVATTGSGTVAVRRDAFERAGGFDGLPAAAVKALA
jgi:glycosyltransferase involved in cell wall biosynthesis